MFTGIIESTGIIKEIINTGTNKTFWVASSLSQYLGVDQSVSHNGVCLTVEEAKNDSHRVTAIRETLAKSNLATLQPGDMLNLERCLVMNGRLDGHFVQGHVDTTGTCLAKQEQHGSWEFRFGFPEAFSSLVIEKGSISLNGISLTIFDVTKTAFSVAIIPFTYAHTNIHLLEPGGSVNLEFDMIGKYVQRWSQMNVLPAVDLKAK